MVIPLGLKEGVGQAPSNDVGGIDEHKRSFVCSVAPMLSVRNGLRAVEFYNKAFGAIEVFHLEDSGGSVVSRPSIEGAEFWVADESSEHGNYSPESLGGWNGANGSDRAGP
jgi:hypothetical protein